MSVFCSVPVAVVPFWGHQSQIGRQRAYTIHGFQVNTYLHLGVGTYIQGGGDNHKEWVERGVIGPRQQSVTMHRRVPLCFENTTITITINMERVEGDGRGQYRTYFNQPMH